MAYQITHVEEIVGVSVVGVVLAAMLSLGAAGQRLGLLPVSSASIAALVSTLPASVLDRLGVILAMPLWKIENGTR